MTKRTFLQFIQYLGVGGTAAAVEWSSFASIMRVYQQHYLAAVAVSFLFATAVNYVLSARFVFIRGRHTAYREMLLLYGVSAVGLTLNLFLMSLFVGRLSVHPMIAKIGATGVVFFWNFSSRKIWVFAEWGELRSFLFGPDGGR
jgi:putative flippase GtrA